MSQSHYIHESIHNQAEERLSDDNIICKLIVLVVCFHLLVCFQSNIPGARVVANIPCILYYHSRVYNVLRQPVPDCEQRAKQ